MAFRDDTHGVAFSDSVDGRFVILTTSNGRTWERIPAGRLPPALPGEGAYDDGRTWTSVASGGFDTFSVAPSGDAGWAAGSGGRISKWSTR